MRNAFSLFSIKEATLFETFRTHAQSKTANSQTCDGTGEAREDTHVGITSKILIIFSTTISVIGILPAWTFVNGINKTDHSNSERPCTTTHKIKKVL